MYVWTSLCFFIFAYLSTTFWKSLVLFAGSDVYFVSQNCPFETANLNLHLFKLMTTLYKSAAVARTVKERYLFSLSKTQHMWRTLFILFVWSYMGNVNLCSSQRLNRKIIVMEFDNFCFDFSSLMIYWDLFKLSANLYTNFFSHGNCVSHHKKEQRKYIICPGVQHVSL